MRENPDLEQLKRQAKELLEAYRAQSPEAVAEVNAYHRTATRDTFALHDAQFVFVGEDDREAKATYLAHELRMFETGSAEIGRPMRAPAGREPDVDRGMVFAGGPAEVAARILNLHKLLGHSRQILQMDVGGMPHQTFLKSIELLGKEVLPKIRKELEP
jgi:alkanesulfonate monooxygenase SsuD/methylene tetrahydromethanopterin reductase-like flavin-dependent oxidoreductase (luciferase family)